MKRNTKFKQTEIGMIPEDWETVKLGSIANINMGQSPPSNTYNTNCNGLPFFQGRTDFGSRYPKVTTWCSEPKKIAKKTEVLLSVRAPIGDTNISNIECCIGRGLAALSMKNKNNEFLSYLLKFNCRRLENDYESGGTVFGCVGKDGLSNFLVAIPKIENEQLSIAKILSDLDSKIELNQEMNKTLEAIGQAIFKHWFIDFEFPNEQGKPYKSSGGEMIFNEELGKEIPKGWTSGKLKELGRIQPGFAFNSKDFTKEGYGLIKIRNIDKNGVVKLEFESYLPKDIFGQVEEKFYLYSGDIIIAMTGAELGKIGIIPKSNNIFLLNQRVAKIISDFKYVMYLWLKSDYCQWLMTGISSASSAQGNISNTDIEKLDIMIPPKEILRNFNMIVESIYYKVADNLGQNIILSDTRDLLLPKLMSGKIRVPTEDN